MDRMDHLLSRLPGEPPPAGLAVTIIRRMHQERRKRMFLRLSAGGLFGTAGLSLALPVVLEWSAGLAVPSDGLVILWDWLTLALQDAGFFFQSALNGMFAMQSAFNPLEGYAVAGLVALGLSALYLLGCLLPREDRI